MKLARLASALLAVLLPACNDPDPQAQPDASTSAAAATPSLEVLAVDLQRLVRFGNLTDAEALARSAGDPDVLLTLAEIWTTTAARARDARSALALAREAAPDRARGYAIEARLAELGGDRVGAARAADAAAHLRPRDPTLRELRRRTRLAVPPDVAPSVAGGGSADALAAPNL